MVSRTYRCQDDGRTLSLGYINGFTWAMQLGMVIGDNLVIGCSDHQCIRNAVRRLVQLNRPAIMFFR
jgi:protein associated with RNAse G/E